MIYTHVRAALTNLSSNNMLVGVVSRSTCLWVVSRSVVKKKTTELTTMVS
jgi:hypothetical protein